MTPVTKSAAHRIGLVPCCCCNPAGLPADQIHTACAWCWNLDLQLHTRFIAVDKAIEWAVAHDVDPHDLPTPAESKSALEQAKTEPPQPPPDTEPGDE